MRAESRSRIRCCDQLRCCFQMVYCRVQRKEAKRKKRSWVTEEMSFGRLVSSSPIKTWNDAHAGQGSDSDLTLNQRAATINQNPAQLGSLDHGYCISGSILVRPSHHCKTLFSLTCLLCILRGCRRVNVLTSTRSWRVQNKTAIGISARQG